MKANKSRFIWVSVLLLMTSFTSEAQEGKGSNTLSYHSFSISPLGLYFGSDTGIAIGGDLSFDYGKNIFGLNLETGTDLNIPGSSDQYVAANLLYGRSFKLNEKVFADWYVGAGYFNYQTYDYIGNTGRKGDIKENTIGVPIGIKLLYQFGPRYSMGVKLGANINSVENIGTLGLVLQWNSKSN